MTANLRYGGIDRATGDDAGLCTTLCVLTRLAPNVVGLQEVDAADPRRIWVAAHRIANELDMALVLGPSAAMGATIGSHTAVLVRTAGTGVRVVDQWPLPGAAEVRNPWVMATLELPGRHRRLHVYSVHMPARSRTAQRRAAESLASWITEHDQDALVVGDWNGYPRRGPAPAPGELAALPRHLRQSRTLRALDGTLAPDYGVDDALVREAELVDVVAELAERAGAPEALVPTADGGARIDRCYANARWAAAACSWQQLRIGSDHDAVAVTFDLREVAA